MQNILRYQDDGRGEPSSRTFRPVVTHHITVRRRIPRPGEQQKLFNHWATTHTEVKQRCLISHPFMEIAETLGVDPTTVRRLIKKHGEDLGIKVERIKSPTRNGRWTDCLSIDDRDRLIDLYENTRGAPGATSTEQLSPQRFGFFYVIQLVPEALPDRVKIGYTDDLQKRINEHRTSAPTAQLIESWPCKRSWDQAAMDSISRQDCKLVMNGVYEGNIKGFIERAKVFFAQMPDPNTQTHLSEHSPLRRVNDPTSASTGLAGTRGGVF